MSKLFSRTTKNCNENVELWNNMFSLEYILLIMIWMLSFPSFLWAIVILSDVCQGKRIFFSIWLIDVSHIVLFVTKLGYNLDAYPVYYPKWATHIIHRLLTVDKNFVHIPFMLILIAFDIDMPFNILINTFDVCLY